VAGCLHLAAGARSIDPTAVRFHHRTLYSSYQAERLAIRRLFEPQKTDMCRSYWVHTMSHHFLQEQSGSQITLSWPPRRTAGRKFLNDRYLS